MAMAAALRAASVPTDTNAATPAARAAARAASVPPGSPSSSRWQWLSVQRTVTSPAPPPGPRPAAAPANLNPEAPSRAPTGASSPSSLLAREQGIALHHWPPAGVADPLAGAGQALGLRPAGQADAVPRHLRRHRDGGRRQEGGD